MDAPEAEKPISHLSIDEARSDLVELIERVAAGERIVIVRDGRAVAQLAAPTESDLPVEGRETNPGRSIHGAMKGQIWIADDFDEVGPEWDPYVK